VQVTLGVTTLLTYVPVSLGSAHQAGALTLFSVALALMYSVKRAPKLASLGAPAMARWLTPAAAASLLLVGAGATQLT
jgi:cytochrome c oxidase assembly protein subunit 15